MSIGVIDCGSKYIEDIGVQLKRLGVEEKRIQVEDLLPEDLLDVAGVIISGSPKNLSQDSGKAVLGSLRILLDLNKPILGICFGHQALGVLYGAKITRENEEVIALETIQVLKEDEIFAGLGDSFLMEERHHEWITLPGEFELLATSDSTEVEVMKHKQKTVFGVQFHPEISGKPGQTLIRNFVEMCA